MEHDFWHSRWNENNIAFHEGEVNERLRAHFAKLALAPGSTVLVPLCGKSLDMWWIREQGHRVLGVELSPVAVRDFFRERAVEPEESTDGRFRRYEGDGVCLLCGDFFQLAPVDVREVAAVYDRAALIALPPPMRDRYVSHLRCLLPEPRPVLLVTVHYPPGEIEGPPFSVDEAEVRSRFEGTWRVRRLDSVEVLDRNPKLRARGLTRLTEHGFLLSSR